MCRIAIGAQKQQIEIPLDVVSDIPGKVDTSNNNNDNNNKQTNNNTNDNNNNNNNTNN